jgi:predicted dinucleotide-binding enzyme
MRIGIIGIGHIGSTLARKLASNGHEVRVANSKGADAVRSFADEIGATPTDAAGAVADADVVILSVPFPAVTKLAEVVAAVPAAVPVIDTGNYYPDMRDPRIPEIDQGMTESVWVAQQLGRPVIKAFNNILAYSLANLGRPSGAPDRLAVAVAGDDPDQKHMAMRIVDEVGFDPVDAGSLADSWRQQPSTPVYCCDWNAEETLAALTAAQKGAAIAKRDRLAEQFAKLGPNPSHADVIAANRLANAP